MNKLLVNSLAFTLDPILYINISNWGKQLQFVPNKRLGYLMLTAEFSMRGDGYNQKVHNTKLAALIFEIDNFIDKGEGANFASPDEILSLPKFAMLIEDITKDLGNSGYLLIKACLEELLTADKKAKEATNLEDYLSNARVSIGLPAMAQMYAIISQEPLNQVLVSLAGEIIRIQSDLATSDKDKNEAGGNNALYLAPKEEIIKKLNDRLQEFNNIEKTTRVDKFLETLIKITSKLYKPKKDYEL